MVDYMLQNSTNYFCLTSKLFLFNEYTVLIQQTNCFCSSERTKFKEEMILIQQRKYFFDRINYSDSTN